MCSQGKSPEQVKLFSAGKWWTRKEIHNGTSLAQVVELEDKNSLCGTDISSEARHLVQQGFYRCVPNSEIL